MCAKGQKIRKMHQGVIELAIKKIHYFVALFFFYNRWLGKEGKEKLNIGVKIFSSPIGDSLEDKYVCL